MRMLVRKSALALVILGCSFSALAQSGDYTELKDQLREMTFGFHLRNSKYDQWKYLRDLRTKFESDLKVLRAHQAQVQKVKAYCASSDDSYTCKNEKSIINADEHLDAAIQDWQSAVLVILNMERGSSTGLAAGSSSKALRESNVLISDIDRLNERAKQSYHMAAREVVAFQEVNPKLFTDSGN